MIMSNDDNKKTQKIKRPESKNLIDRPFPLQDKRVYPQHVSSLHSSVSKIEENAKIIDDNNFLIDAARAAILDKELSGNLTRLQLIGRAVRLAMDRNHRESHLSIALLKCLVEAGYMND
jgi:hypothetical protein